jgi:hypothetical protein
VRLPHGLAEECWNVWVELEHQIDFCSILRVPSTFMGDGVIRNLQDDLLHLTRRTAICHPWNLSKQPPIIASPCRCPANLPPICVKQSLDYWGIDAVQNFVAMGVPVIDEMLNDFCAELEGGVVECRRNLLGHVAKGEGNSMDTCERG